MAGVGKHDLEAEVGKDLLVQGEVKEIDVI
jgi:hypothetical protein